MCGGFGWHGSFKRRAFDKQYLFENGCQKKSGEIINSGRIGYIVTAQLKCRLLIHLITVLPHISTFVHFYKQSQPLSSLNNLFFF